MKPPAPTIAFTAAALSAFSLQAFSLCSAAASPQPNIVFILSDDLGWADLACMGSKYYETPNLDRLAAQGVRFTYAYAMPNCAPTRACLWTGKYSPRTGIYTVGDSNRGKSFDRQFNAPANVTTLPANIPVLPELLRGSGYLTALYGKWHLDPANGPAPRGWDSVVWYDGGPHFNFKTKPHIPHPKEQFLADFLTDRGIEFMQRATKENKPFFLAITHFAVHQPVQAPQADIDHFKSKKTHGQQNRPAYAGMIRALDATVGRLLAELDCLGIADNTVIIFTSDNGGFLGETDNTPLRGGKGMHYEGGIRVPYIVRWPGVTKPGSTCDTPIHAIDLVPTVLDLVGIASAGNAEFPLGDGAQRRPIVSRPQADSLPNPKSKIENQLDGLSYVPLLKTQNPQDETTKAQTKTLAERTLYWHCPVYLEMKGNRTKRDLGPWRSTPGAVIRQGPWKLIETLVPNAPGKIELYNVVTDISEKTDLSKQHPQLAAKLLAQLHQWRDALHAPMPVPNPDYQKPTAAKSEKAAKKTKKSKAPKLIGEEGEVID